MRILTGIKYLFNMAGRCKKIYLSHFTTFRCIREMRYSGAYNSPYDKYDFGYNRCSLGVEQVSAPRQILSYDYPFNSIFVDGLDLDVLVTSSGKMYKKSSIKYHFNSMNLPQNVFIKVNSNLTITGPELTFLQLASQLDIRALIMAGMELCGTYAICKDSRHETDAVLKGFVDNLAPATSVEKIQRVINILEQNKSKGYLKYIKKAREALRCIGNYSASPQESILYVMLAGLRKYGMFKINNLQLNYEYVMNNKSSRLAGQNKLKIDIAIPNNRIAIEYDSRMFHTILDQNQRDKRRSDALIYNGWIVFNVVPAQLANIEIVYDLGIKILKLNKQYAYIRLKNFDIQFGITFRFLKSLDLEYFNLN